MQGESIGLPVSKAQRAVRRMRVLGSLALLFGLVAPAHADDKEAARLYMEGKEALQQGDLKTARDRLEAALAIGEGAGLYLRLAELEEKSDHPAKCLDYAERAVAKAESATPKRPRVLRAAEKQRARCDEITPMLTVRLPETLPEDAAVYEDGKRLKVSGGKLVRRLEPGEHVYRLEAPGRSVTSEIVRVEAGERAELELALGPADSGSSVPWKSISTWTGVGLLGVGVLAGAAAISAKGDLDDQCNDKSCPPSAESDYDRSARWATVSTVGVIGGAALLGLGLYVLEDDAADTKTRDTSRVRVDLEASPRAGVLTGTWTF